MIKKLKNDDKSTFSLKYANFNMINEDYIKDEMFVLKYISMLTDK